MDWPVWLNALQSATTAVTDELPQGAFQKIQVCPAELE